MIEIESKYIGSSNPYIGGIEMKRKYYAVAFTIAAILSSVGCTNDAASDTISSVQKGGYVEEDCMVLGLPSIMGELCFVDDTICFLDAAQAQRFFKDEENTFQSSSAISLDVLGLEGRINIRKAIVSPERDYFVSLYTENAEENLYAYIPYGEENSVFSLDFAVEYMEFSSDGRIFAVDFIGTVYEIDPLAGNAKKLFDTKGRLGAFDIANGYLTVLDEEELFFYSLTENTLVETPKSLQQFFEEQNLEKFSEYLVYDLCSGEENTIYIACASGLYRYVMDGNSVEQVIGGMAYQIGNPSNTIGSVLQDLDGSFYIAFQNGNVVHYVYDAEVVLEKTSELKLYCLQENKTFSQIISNYQVENPNVQVSYEVGMRTGVTYDDALKNLTTKILAGDAPDVMMMDGMDIQDYAEKNALLDLTDYMDSIDPEDVILENIANWNNTDGLYSMACKFRIPFFAAATPFLEQTHSVSDLADRVEEIRTSSTIRVPILSLSTAENILQMALLYEGNTILQNNTLQTEELSDLLQACRRIYQNDDPRTGLFSYNNRDLEDYSIYEPDFRLYTAITESDLCMAVGTVNAFRSEGGLNQLTSIDTCTPSVDVGYRLGLTEDSTLFVPVCNLGISTAAKNKEDAVDFLATAFSTDLQKIELLDGFPVNQNALTYFYEQNKKPGNDVSTWTCAFSSSDAIVIRSDWMGDIEVSAFQKTIASFDTPVYLDRMTESIFLEACVPYLEGGCTLEQAIDNLQAQLSLRMKE